MPGRADSADVAEPRLDRFSLIHARTVQGHDAGRREAERHRPRRGELIAKSPFGRLALVHVIGAAVDRPSWGRRFPAFRAARRAITSQIVTDRSASFASGSYRQPPSLFCELTMSCTARSRLLADARRAGHAVNFRQKQRGEAVIVHRTVPGVPLVENEAIGLKPREEKVDRPSHLAPYLPRPGVLPEERNAMPQNAVIATRRRLLARVPNELSRESCPAAKKASPASIACCVGRDKYLGRHLDGPVDLRIGQRGLNVGREESEHADSDEYCANSRPPPATLPTSRRSYPGGLRPR